MQNRPKNTPSLSQFKKAGNPHSDAVSGARLGIYAKTEAAQPKNASLFWPVNHDTGETFPLTIQSDDTLTPLRNSRSQRAYRYVLKTVVNELLPRYRVFKCHRWRLPDSPLQVLKAKESFRAYYVGLQICASVWHCPICASKISEHRRSELREAMDKAETLGLSAYLLTLTVPHGLGDDINRMLDQMMQAWRSFTTHRAGKSALASIGRRGFVRALEVTHGKNGFHPHFHVLMFLENPPSPEDSQKILSSIWQTACERVGLPRPSDEHGCRVDNGSKAASYVSKGSWGLDAEMTKGHLKRSKSKEGRTPTDFLGDFLLGDEQAGKLFQVYAKAFHGRRQLYWSNGLRAILGMQKSITDEEAAEHQEHPSEVVLGDITMTQWKAILATGSEAHILDLAEENPAALPSVLAGLVRMAGLCDPPD